LRSAEFNLLFCLAKLEEAETHLQQAEKVTTLFSPVGFAVAGNSYLLVSDEDRADYFYQQLEKISGWENKTHFYRASFLVEQELWLPALKYAILACFEMPKDAQALYLLTKCYEATGEHSKALSTLKLLLDLDKSEWLRFYKFTLERQGGEFLDATETLLSIPIHYFEDEEELKAAKVFASERGDFVLMKHLKSK
jgi:tetratricopeptide (TPR) repeat protein